MARNSGEEEFLLKNTSMYKSILELKKPENDLFYIKKKIKILSLCCENINGLSNELFQQSLKRNRKES